MHSGSGSIFLFDPDADTDPDPDEAGGDLFDNQGGCGDSPEKRRTGPPRRGGGLRHLTVHRARTL